MSALCLRGGLAVEGSRFLKSVCSDDDKSTLRKLREMQTIKITPLITRECYYLVDEEGARWSLKNVFI